MGSEKSVKFYSRRLSEGNNSSVRTVKSTVMRRLNRYFTKKAMSKHYKILVLIPHHGGEKLA